MSHDKKCDGSHSYKVLSHFLGTKGMVPWCFIPSVLQLWQVCFSSWLTRLYTIFVPVKGMYLKEFAAASIPTIGHNVSLRMFGGVFNPEFPWCMVDWESLGSMEKPCHSKGKVEVVQTRNRGNTGSKWWLAKPLRGKKNLGKEVSGIICAGV